MKFSPQGSAFAFADGSIGEQGPAWQAGLGLRMTF
jgi:hypothetical protein